MNEKNYIYYVVIVLIAAFLFFSIGRFSVSIFNGKDAANGNGNGTDKLEKQLIESGERAIDLENRIGAIEDSGDRVEKELINGIERSGSTIDNIERLRIIFDKMEKSFPGAKCINAMPVIDNGCYNYKPLKEQK
jgi:hypothetical protein